jgi:hypothetical protein
MTRTTTLTTARITLAMTGALMVSGLFGCTEPAVEDGDIAEPGAEMAAIPGVPDLYGDSPDMKGADVERARGMKFEPEYYAVAYLQFQQNGGLIAKHAYFPGVGTTAKVECAIEFLISEPKEGDWDPLCRPYLNPEGRIDSKPPKPTAGPIVKNFQGFGFGSQQTLYVFVDNPNVQFNELTPVSFTPYGAFDAPGKAGSIRRHKNYSFYDARVDLLGSGRRGLIMNNYNRGPDGGDITSDANSATYSINFNLLVCRDRRATCTFTDPEQVIPLAIDPDTGNGWGSKP